MDDVHERSLQILAEKDRECHDGEPVAIKKEFEAEVETETDIKDFAETTMNELLGWYGYDKVDSRDTQGLNLNRFTSSTSEAETDENNKTISDCIHIEVHGNSDDSSDRADDRTESSLCEGSTNGTGRTSRSSPTGPHSQASPTNLPNGYVICAWCQKVGMKLFTLRSSNGAKVFCSEICFTQCRRASFKKYKVCDWCKHIRHTVNYVDFKDGEQQLQFCSDKCLNQYKMNIFCKETQAHLQMHPHLHQDKGAFGGPSSVSSSPSPSCPNGSEGALTLITPDLWLRNCKDRDSVNQDLSSENENYELPCGDVGYRSDNDNDSILVAVADKPLPETINHHEGKENSSNSRQRTDNCRKYSRLRERRRHCRLSNSNEASKTPSLLRHQHHYHRRSHRLDARRNVENGVQTNSSIQRSSRTFKANSCKEDASRSSQKHVGAISTSLVDKLNNSSPILLNDLVLQSSIPTATINVSSKIPIPSPPSTTSPPPVPAPSFNTNLRTPSPMSFPHLTQANLFRMPSMSQLQRHSHVPFLFPQGMQHPVPTPQMSNIQPSSAQQGLAMPIINPHQQPQYYQPPLPGAQGHFSPNQNGVGSLLPPITVMVPYPIFLPIPIPIPIPIPFPMEFYNKSEHKEATNSSSGRPHCDNKGNMTESNTSNASVNANIEDPQSICKTSEQYRTSNANVVNTNFNLNSKMTENCSEENGAIQTASTSSDLRMDAPVETLSSSMLRNILEEPSTQVKKVPGAAPVVLMDELDEQPLPKEMLEIQNSSPDGFSLEDDDLKTTSNCPTGSDYDNDSSDGSDLSKSESKNGGNGAVYCDGLQIPSSPTSRLRHHLRLQVKLFSVNSNKRKS